MSYTITEIAKAVGGVVHGDGSLRITSAAEPAHAQAEQLAIALTPAFRRAIPSGEARAALVNDSADWEALGVTAVIEVQRPRFAMAHLTSFLDHQEPGTPGIHPTAIVDPTARIALDASIGPFSIIGTGAELGSGVVVAEHVSVGPDARIGAGTQIHAGVRIGAKVEIGETCCIHPNCTLGADGFSFVSEEVSHIETARATLGAETGTMGKDIVWYKIHSLGGVVIGDDVEIGANSTVDAGTVRATTIGSGTKIDNLVQVGHNAQVGQSCLLCAQSGVAGSAVIGDRAVLGGKAGVADNINVGADAVLGGGTIALSNVPAGQVMLGYPAMPMARQIESYKALRRLPRLLASLRKSDK